MKRTISLIVAVILITLPLCSCMLRDENTHADSNSSESIETTGMIKNIVTEDTSLGTEPSSPETVSSGNYEEPSVIYPIGFYIGSDDTLTYDLKTEYSADLSQKDENGNYASIANFGVVPSTEKTLYGDKYTALWLNAAEKAGMNMDDTVIKFKLSVKLKDGNNITYQISSPNDADKISDDGYLSVKLFDDVHQAEGVAYSALSGDSFANSIVTTIRIISNEKSDGIENIILSAEASLSNASVSSGVATIRIVNG